MKATVNWIGGAAFVGVSPGGHRILMDGPPEGGGRDLGPRPMETLLLGMGACSCYDVVAILRKSRQDIQDCQVEMSAERAGTEPRVFTSIHLHFIVTGSRLKENQVERAIKLSAEKYCSASIMLGKTANITHDYTIKDIQAK
ncbi:MAG: OsmC family protein [Gammaproteobacteria bacterium]